MKRTGFTLVDLMATIFIVQVSLLSFLPFLQNSRENARLMQCGNNLKQQALASLNYESAIRYFPSGGWNVNYVGDPNYGFGTKQPGTWTYSLLPFMEQSALWELGMDGKTGTCERKENSVVLETPLTSFVCPSRREAKVYPLGVTDYKNSNFSGSEGAKSDYAANYGSTAMKIGNNASYETWNSIYPSARPTGVIYDVSEVMLGEIRDGASRTYLIGEKFVFSNYYEVEAPGDRASMYAGISNGNTNSNLRSAGVLESEKWYLPTKDAERTEANLKAWRGFGSAHEETFGMATCDGAVHRISYKIDGETHAYLANRRDEHDVIVPE